MGDESVDNEDLGLGSMKSVAQMDLGFGPGLMENMRGEGTNNNLKRIKKKN